MCGRHAQTFFFRRIMVAMSPRAPGDLGPAGRQLWRSMTGAYEFTPGEAAILGEACRVRDLLARLDAALAAGPLVVAGSKGQDRPAPLLAPAARQRQVLDQLLRSLALPFPEEREGRRRSPAAVAAAQERWRKRKKASGGEVA
jgi:hypothetical protein